MESYESLPVPSNDDDSSSDSDDWSPMKRQDHHTLASHDSFPSSDEDNIPTDQEDNTTSSSRRIRGRGGRGQRKFTDFFKSPSRKARPHP